MGVLTTTQHFLPLLRAMPGGGGRIVTVGSVFGLISSGDTGVTPTSFKETRSLSCWCIAGVLYVKTCS